MGLTIHYTLNSKSRTPAQATRLIERLREAACDLPVEKVGPLIEFRAQVDVETPDFPGGLFHADNSRLDRKTNCRWPLKSLVAFQVWPGPGCETAEFGLARFRDARPAKAGRKRPAQPWTWNAFCKTQYASDPRAGGVGNFLRCHLSVIRLLDVAKGLGIRVRATDEGGYWKRRSRRALLAELTEWNEMVAAVGGTLKDAFGAGLSGPIFEFPDFERLEAKGQKRRTR